MCKFTTYLLAYAYYPYSWVFGGFRYVSVIKIRFDLGYCEPQGQIALVLKSSSSDMKFFLIKVKRGSHDDLLVMGAPFMAAFNLTLGPFNSCYYLFILVFFILIAVHIFSYGL